MKRRLIAAAISACFASAPAWANPTAPQVVNGSASFTQAGKLLTVTNSNGAIINWNTFSIAAGETTRFNQASAGSSVLNRVLANDPSVLLGTLSSNGRVWLVNPAGIMVGQGARIDVAGFIASTLNVRNEDFLAGRLNFGATPNAGKVENYGQITTPSGGSVYLVAPTVTNNGIINTPNGEVLLATGQTVQLVDTGTPGVNVAVTGATGNATNLGQIIAEAGRIGMAGVLVKNSGTLNASSVVKQGGRIFLKASQDAYVDGAGRIVTTGTKGGSIEVLGKRVAVTDQAQLDASGDTAGGTVLLGGDYQGRNPDIQNANITYFGPQASIKADAAANGDGGRVIVWADDTTRAYGSISARGGADGGNGGFVETSGHRWLDIAGARVDTRAPYGRTGNWLLDPVDVTISMYGGYPTYGGAPFAPTTSPSTIYAEDISNALGSTDVTIQTNGGSGGAGNITATGVSISYGGSSLTSLTLAAYGGSSSTGGNIQITDSYFSAYGGLTLLAGWNGGGFTSGNVISGTGNISISGSRIQSDGGAVNLWAGKDIALSNSGSAGTWVQGATMDVAAGNDLTLTGGSASSGHVGPSVMLQSMGTQTVSAGNQILLQAGSANSTYGGSAYGGSVTIMANGDQTISAGVMRLWGGASGHDNVAQFQANGGQTINVYGALLELKGGGDSSTAVYGGAGSYNNQARIQHGQWNPADSYSGTLDQTITVYGSGTISLQAGSGTGVLGNYSESCYVVAGDVCRGSSNDASIINGIGIQKLDFVNGGSLTVTGGGAGTNNWAGISNERTASAQNILGNPNIALTGGSGGGSQVSYGGETFTLSNDAGINSKAGTQTVYAGSITLNAGNATYGGAGIGNDSNSALTVSTTGDFSMYGGTSGASDPYASGVYIGTQAGGTINLNIGGSLYAKAGSGTASPIIIGSQSAAADVHIGSNGDVRFIADASPIAIGAQSGYGGTIEVKANGSLFLTGGGSTAGNVLIGGPSDANGTASVTLAAGNNLTVTGNTGGVWLGVKDLTGASGNSVSLKAGWDPPAGGGGFPSGYGGDINLSGPVNIQTDAGSGTIGITAYESSAGARGSVSVGAGTSAYGNSIEIIAAGNNDIAGSLTSAGHIYLDGGWNNYAGHTSQAGGNLTLAATSQLEAGTYVGMTSQAGSNAPYGGGTVTQNGSLVSNGGESYIYGDRDLHIDGSVTTNNGYGLYLSAGYHSTMRFGGSAVFGSSSQVRASGQLTTYAYAGADSRGDIVQYGGSSIRSDNNISFNSKGSVNLNGRVETPSSLLIDGGEGGSTYGGNIALGASSQIYGGTVQLNARRGSGDDTTGNISQAAGGLLQVESVASLYAFGSGNVDLLGRTVDHAGGPVHIEAGYDNLHYGSAPGYYPGRQLFADKSITVSSLEAPGSSVELYATGPILANTQNVGSIDAHISNSSSGGIQIQNTGALPSGVTLIDNAQPVNGVNKASASFLNTESIGGTSGINLQTPYGGDLALLSNGSINWYGGGTLSTPSGSVLIAAVGSVDLNATLTQPVDLALSSGDAINVNSYVHTSGTGTVALIAPSVNINNQVNAADDVGIVAGTVNLAPESYTSANHDVIFAAGNVTATGAGVSAGNNIVAAVTGDLRLNNGSAFYASNDIFVKLLGTNSTLYLNDGVGYTSPSSMWAQALLTIHLEFPNRASGGLVVNGAAVNPLTFVAASTGDSGLFNAGVPATVGAGLDVIFGISDVVVPPDSIVAALGALPPPPPPPPPPPAEPPGAGGTPGTGGTLGAGETGGTEGTFGGSSGTKKDDKDDKGKTDSGTGQKKPEDKPSGKKPGTCS